jgi:hypothetical protein
MVKRIGKQVIGTLFCFALCKALIYFGMMSWGDIIILLLCTGIICTGIYASGVGLRL